MPGGIRPLRRLCQGWGRVLLDNALYFTGQGRKLWVLDDQQGFATARDKARTFRFRVGKGAEPLKITLVWTDFPSTPAASLNLVNDLDLTVSGPKKKVWLGNVFADGQSVSSASGGSPDRINNVEQVQLDNPAPGLYTVTIRPVNVPEGPQPFAIVVTGDVTARRR
jgi:hypothetical protein